MNLPILLLKLLGPRRRSFERSTNYPVKAQTDLLLRLLKRNRNTLYGRKYSFDKIRSIDDFRRLVPVNSYETIRPYVDRMAKGEENILVRDKVVFFGATSGTTNLPKLIPTTVYSEKIKEDLINLWSYCISIDHPEVLNGRILAIVSPEVEGFTECGIPFGAESGYSYRNLPGYLKGLYSLPYDVFMIEDYEARHYAILRISMAQNISNIATLNPNTIVLIMRKIEKWQDEIVRDIENGTMTESVKISPEIRSRLVRSLKPDRLRAAELKRILSEKGRLLPRDFWPGIKLIECWQGGMMKLYLKELNDLFGPVIKRDIGCVSTEARSSIPIADDSSSGPLAIETNFYEFRPRSDSDKRAGGTLLCDELETGGEYYLIVTTAGGLYRYDIDDIVRVTGHYNRTPLIEFVQKGSGATSLAGEKLYESHVSEAMARLIERERLRLEYFCAVAHPTSRPYYAFLIEFSGDTPVESYTSKLITLLESELRAENREYDFVRKSQLLYPPALKILRRGSFEKYRAKRTAGRSAGEGQFKAPELTADTSFEENFEIESVVDFPGTDRW